MNLEEIQRLRERAGETLMSGMLTDLYLGASPRGAKAHATEWMMKLSAGKVLELLDLAEVALRAGKEVLVKHSGVSDQPERTEFGPPWAWLKPGDKVVVLRKEQP